MLQFLNYSSPKLLFVHLCEVSLIRSGISRIFYYFRMSVPLVFSRYAWLKSSGGVLERAAASSSKDLIVFLPN